MYLKIYEPNEIILKVGESPKSVHFLVSGCIQAFQKPADGKPDNKNAMKLKTEPGPRLQAQVLQKTTFGECFLEKLINSKDPYEVLGPESDLNGMVSPYTYIAKERTIAICSPSIQLYRDILRQNQDKVLVDMVGGAR